jgi:hypothetical protein
MHFCSFPVLVNFVVSVKSLDRPVHKVFSPGMTPRLKQHAPSWGRRSQANFSFWCVSFAFVLSLLFSSKLFSDDAINGFRRWQTLAAGDNPSGAVCADFNSDGKLDLAVNNEGSNSVSVFLGIGNGLFSEQAVYPTPSPDRIATSDFNGDGRSDILVLNFSARQVGVFLSNSDGTFQVPIYTNLNAFVSVVDVGDFNDDGYQDFAVLRYIEDSIMFWFGQGDGNFSLFSELTVEGVQNFQVDDFDNDGLDDLFCISHEVAIYKNQGDGTFTQTQNFSYSGILRALDSSDVDHDGLVDLLMSIVITSARSEFAILRNTGNGNFVRGETYSIDSNDNTYARFKQIDNDGIVDVAILGPKGFEAWTGNGDGTFTLSSPSDVLFRTNDIVFADFNGDGVPDIANPNVYFDDVTIAINNGDGTYLLPTEVNTGNLFPPPTQLATADLNEDGFLDLTYIVNQKLGIVMGQGDGQFGAPRQFLGGLTRVSYHTHVHFDDDDCLDLLYIDDTPIGGEDSRFSIQKGVGDGNFFPPVAVTETSNSLLAHAVAADFDNDGKQDLAFDFKNRAGAVQGGVLVFFNLGADQLSAPLRMVSLRLPKDILATDLNQDGNEDLALICSSDNQSFFVSIFLGNGDRTFQHETTFPVASWAYDVAADDWNSDGFVDLIVCHLTGEVDIHPGNGDGTFGTPMVVSLHDVTPYQILIADLNGDGDSEAVTLNNDFSSNEPDEGYSISVICKSTGANQHRVSRLCLWDAPMYLVGHSPSTNVVAGDFDLDGRMDVATGGNNIFLLFNESHDVGPFEVAPEAVKVIFGQHQSGDLTSLSQSDNSDLSIRRSSIDLIARTGFEVTGTSPESNPDSIRLIVEGSVFARSGVTQTIDLYDFDSATWEQLDSRMASRFSDVVVDVAATGELSRFVESGSNRLKARVQYRSTASRQQFSSNTDQFIWTIGQ